MPGAQATNIHSLPTEIKSDSSPPKTSIESATVQLKELDISSNNSFTLATSNSEAGSISSIPEQGVLLSSAERQEKKHSPDVARLRQTQEDSFDSVGSHGVSRSPSQTSYSSMEIEMGWVKYTIEKDRNLDFLGNVAYVSSLTCKASLEIICFLKTVQTN